MIVVTENNSKQAKGNKIQTGSNIQVVSLNVVNMPGSKIPQKIADVLIDLQLEINAIKEYLIQKNADAETFQKEYIEKFEERLKKATEQIQAKLQSDNEEEYMDEFW